MTKARAVDAFLVWTLSILLAGLFLLTPAEGARTSLHAALSDEGGKATGVYYDDSKQRKAARAARDEAAQEKLWALSEELLGLRGAATRRAA